MSIELSLAPIDEGDNMENGRQAGIETGILPVGESVPIEDRIGIPPTSERVIGEHRVLIQALTVGKQVLATTTQKRIDDREAADWTEAAEEDQAKVTNDATLVEAKKTRDEAVRIADEEYAKVEEAHTRESRRINYRSNARQNETKALLEAIRTVYDSGVLSLQSIELHSDDIIRVLEIIDERYQELLGAQQRNALDRATQLEAWGQLSDERDQVMEEKESLRESQASLRAESNRILVEASSITSKAQTQLDKDAQIHEPDEATINRIFNEQGQLTDSQAKALGRVARIDSEESTLRRGIEQCEASIALLEAKIDDKRTTIDDHDAIADRIQAAKMVLEEHRQRLLQREEALRDVLKEWGSIVDKDVSELVHVSSIVADFLKRTEDLEAVTGSKKLSVQDVLNENGPIVLPDWSSRRFYAIYEGYGDKFGGDVDMKNIPDIATLLGLPNSDEKQTAVDSWVDSMQEEVWGAVETLTKQPLGGLANRLAAAATARTITTGPNGRHSS